MSYTSPMTRIGVRELNQHTSRYIGKVKDGETVEVTEHGHLVPPRSFPARRPAPGRSAGAELIVMRDEERY